MGATPRPGEIAILTMTTIHLAAAAIHHPAEAAILMMVGIRLAVTTQEEPSSCSGTEATFRPSQAAMEDTEATSSGRLQGARSRNVNVHASSCGYNNTPVHLAD